MYVAVLLKNTLFGQAIFCHSLCMLHELSPKMGTTALNNAAVLSRLCCTNGLGMGPWLLVWVHYYAHWHWDGHEHGHGHVRGQNAGRPPCGRALVWCAYTKGRAFSDSAFCVQPMVAA